jgi:lambda repressor-like predicted transcriptional regulator
MPGSRISLQSAVFAGTVGVAISLAAERATAAEYCVTCMAPAQMYACVIEGVAADAPADARHQLLCITELATQGGHESCTVPRSAPKPCPGVQKVVARATGTPAAPAAPSQPDSNTVTGDGNTAGADGKDGTAAADSEAVTPGSAEANGPNSSVHEKTGTEATPRTVEEMAKRSIKGLENAGDALKQSSEKAGNSVSEAAKKTWECVTSLFSKC